MIILIILSLLSIGFISLWIFSDYFSSWNTLGAIGTACFGVTLLVLIAVIPINNYLGKAKVEEYHALKETIKESRENNTSEMERAALISEIAEFNKELASTKYRNDSIISLWMYDGLAELDYLK